MMHRLALVAMVALAASSSGARQSQADFAVRIQLNAADARGFCVSAHLSERNQATVRVVCQNSTYVSIEPREPSAHAGRNGAATNYHLTRVAYLPRRPIEAESASTETELRVLDWAAHDGRLELVVKF